MMIDPWPTLLLFGGMLIIAIAENHHINKLNRDTDAKLEPMKKRIDETLKKMESSSKQQLNNK
ncbi:MAG: hypothetical protein WCT04_06265 [Planctomycetota bacterium]